MSRRISSMVLLLPLSGCVSVTALEGASMQHAINAQQLAELGNGPAAAREAHLAISDREAAHRLAEKRSGYWESEVLMK